MATRGVQWCRHLEYTAHSVTKNRSSQLLLVLNSALTSMRNCDNQLSELSPLFHIVEKPVNRVQVKASHNPRYHRIYLRTFHELHHICKFLPRPHRRSFNLNILQNSRHRQRDLWTCRHPIDRNGSSVLADTLSVMNSFWIVGWFQLTFNKFTARFTTSFPAPSTMASK